MTKLELLKLVNMLKYYQSTKKITKIENNIKYDRSIFPDIPELNDDFNVLTNEIKNIIEKREIIKNEIDSITKECNHEIRLVYYGLFSDSYKCPMCGKALSDSDFDLTNKLRSHCVLLPSKDQYEINDIKDGYDFKLVYNVILDILKDKDDSEDINLIKEFANLHLKYCEIKNEDVEDEKYILIIGGSNIENITSYSYFTSDNHINSKDIFNYFKDSLNIRIKYIENEKVIGCISKVRGNGTVVEESYSSIESLNKILNSETVDYDIIIDATNLYEYIIENNKIEVKKYDLKLKEKFKGAKIIRIEDITKDKSKIENNSADLHFTYSNNKYYDDINQDSKTDVDSTCNKIKKLLKKRNLSS